MRREASGARGGAARARRPEADLAGALEQRGEHGEDEAADDDVEDAGEVDEAQRALRLLRALRAALALVHPPQALQLREARCSRLELDYTCSHARVHESSHTFTRNSLSRIFRIARFSGSLHVTTAAHCSLYSYSSLKCASRTTTMKDRESECTG